MGKPLVAINSTVIYKQLVEVLEHRTASTDNAVEPSPTSSYGTAPEPDDESEAYATPIRGPMNGIIVVSSAVLKETPEACDKLPQKGTPVVPFYPITNQNIKPARGYVDTSKMPPHCPSFAFLTPEEEGYISTLQDNWDNPFVPPIQPEAPEGSTLNKSLNHHSLQTRQRFPPRQIYAASNVKCVTLLSEWETDLTREEVESESERQIFKNTNIHKCGELRKELLVQRSSFDEHVSTKLLLARAVWQHEAFRQVRKERDRVKELEAGLAKERKDKEVVEAALAHILEEQRTNPHVEHLEAFSKHMRQELEENYSILKDLEGLQQAMDKGGAETIVKAKVGTILSKRMLDYVLHRKIALEKEKQLLGKFVDIRTFKHDKGNMIMLTLEEIVENFQKKKREIQTQLEEARESLARGSTSTSPGLPGMPTPPPGAAVYDSVEELEKKVKQLERKNEQMAYSSRVASSFTKFWVLYRECKYQRGEQADLGEGEVEEEEDDYYGEGPCPDFEASEVPVLPEDQKMQWLTDLITKAVEAWSNEVYGPNDTIISLREKCLSLAKSLDCAATMLQKSQYQKTLVGSENRRLRVKVKDLETKLSGYIDFMQKIGIEADNELVGTHECLYTSIQSLRSLKDENLRLRLLVDGLNGKIEKLNRALDLCEETLVPWPSANRLEESLAESLQLYDHMFAEHKSWLRVFGKAREDSGVEDGASGGKKADEEEESDVIAKLQRGVEALGRGHSTLSASAGGLDTGGKTLRKLMGVISAQSSPRKRPLVAVDEHSIAKLEMVEAMNVDLVRRRRDEDEQVAKELDAMMGLTQLRQSKFSENFDDERDYARLTID